MRNPPSATPPARSARGGHPVGVEADVGLGGPLLATGLQRDHVGRWLANVGVEALASGSVGSQWGVFGRANGSSAEQHIGLLGSAEGGSINWAGYFSAGNVFIHNYLGIGTDYTLPPSYPLDVQAAQAVGRFTTTGDANGRHGAQEHDQLSHSPWRSIQHLLGLPAVAYQDYFTCTRRQKGCAWEGLSSSFSRFGRSRETDASTGRKTCALPRRPDGHREDQPILPLHGRGTPRRPAS